ncbi:kinase-like domain-containing protein, partial [Scleroderma citrinum]
ILLAQHYSHAVNWWAFSVLTYRMLFSQSSFCKYNKDRTFDAILEDKPLYPITTSRNAVSILQKLLATDLNHCPGGGKEDAEEVKRHLFFKDINFDDLLHKHTPPLYFQIINSVANTSNFNEEFTREQPTLTTVLG